MKTMDWVLSVFVLKPYLGSHRGLPKSCCALQLSQGGLSKKAPYVGSNFLRAVIGILEPRTGEGAVTQQKPFCAVAETICDPGRDKRNLWMPVSG